MGVSDSRQAGVSISLSDLREVLSDEIAVIFSQFEGAPKPREYEVDYIVGCIAQRGQPLGRAFLNCGSKGFLDDFETATRGGLNPSNDSVA